jgi:hypothetical protein
MPAAKKPTDLTEEMNQILADAAKVAEETQELREAIDKRQLPWAAQKALSDDLRRRMLAIDLRNERLVIRHQAYSIAYRQRTGVEPKPGDELSAEDCTRGERIAQAMLQPPPEGLKN